MTIYPHDLHSHTASGGSDIGDAIPTEAMSLDMSPTEATILENFATGDAKPTDTIMLDDTSSNDGNEVDNKGSSSFENFEL